ncbi:MAG: hypothetical protein GF335_03910 [Candidatus Moranbacteria bacterium]|nr:hypothetical protein [Candidatus Moranbacteria bacterium]
MASNLFVRIFKKLFKYSLVLAGAVIVFTVILHLVIQFKTKDQIFCDLNKLEKKQTALILGALVRKDGRMSDIYLDRVRSAIELYQNDKVDKILISADNSRINYNETKAAEKYLIEKGIPSQDVYLDYAGFDTYDSLYRAVHIFKVKSIIIVSQKFHLPRALYISQDLRLDALGYCADKRQYQYMRSYRIREKLAQVKAFFDVLFDSKSKFLGDPIVIE